jgi:hypothetical protein
MGRVPAQCPSKEVLHNAVCTGRRWGRTRLHGWWTKNVHFRSLQRSLCAIWPILCFRGIEVNRASSARKVKDILPLSLLTMVMFTTAFAGIVASTLIDRGAAGADSFLGSLRGVVQILGTLLVVPAALIHSRKHARASDRWYLVTMSTWTLIIAIMIVLSMTRRDYGSPSMLIGIAVPLLFACFPPQIETHS